jgi:hypothetical protein
MDASLARRLLKHRWCMIGCSNPYGLFGAPLRLALMRSALFLLTRYPACPASAPHRF